MSNTEQPGVPEEALFAVKCWLYPQLCRFNKHGGRFVGILANAYKSYDKITAWPTPFNSVEFVDESLVHDATFRQICEWIAQYTTRLTSDLAAARENASQNADRYLACEKRFEEAIAQRDAANLRVEGLIRDNRASSEEVVELRQEVEQSESKFNGHLQHVSRFLTEMYQTMIDPLDEPWPSVKVAELCEMLLNQAREDREKLNRSPFNYPADWNKDSSLETWFPLTAEEMVNLKAENAALKARVEQLSRPVRKPKGTVVYENPDGSADRMDRECIQICDAMNGLPGIETISSCCGHGFQPFRIYFVAEFLDDLRPLMELIDESEIWRMRCSMATGNMEIYFILESAHGWLDAYVQADELAKLIRARSERSSQ